MRGGFSSDDLQKAWRYAVHTDFHSHPNGGVANPIETITMTYDTANRFLPFVRPSENHRHAYAISPDDRWLAQGVGMSIDLYDLATSKLVTTLLGHTVKVGSLAFAPGHPGTLVTSGMSRDASGQKLQPEIVVWDLGGEAERAVKVDDRVRANDIASDAVQHIQARLSQAAGSISMEDGEKLELTETLETLLSRFISRSSLPPTARRLTGRLCSSFQSPVFNNAGTTLIYLPGPPPRSNGDVQWDIRLHDLVSRQEITLSGHRDALMWIGFSPDDSLVVSACWDGTFRVWRAETGEQVHVWTTDKQNWAGCFAPDNERFLGTDGDGKVRVWSLKTGEMLYSFETEGQGHSWRRSVDWSPDGKYILVGGERLGEILLFNVEAEPTAGSLVPAQARTMSFEKTRMDDDTKRMIAGFPFAVNSLRFMFDDDQVTFGSTSHIDIAVEFVSLARGKRWRIVPFERTEDDEADFARLDKTKEGYTICPEWCALSKTRQVVVVSSDGVRFWKLA